MEQVLIDILTALQELKIKGADLTDIYIVMSQNMAQRIESPVKKIVINTGATRLSRIWAEQVKLPIILKKMKIHKLFSLCNILPIFFTGHSFVMVHDLHWFRRSLLFRSSKDLLRLIYVKTAITLSILKAQRIYTGSPHAAMDIFNLFNLKARVFPWGYKSFFDFGPDNSEDNNDHVCPQKDFILFVGQTHRRKNVVNLIKAYNMIDSAFFLDNSIDKSNPVKADTNSFCEKIPKLVILGTEGDGEKDLQNTIRKFNLNDRVIRVINADISELRSYYKAALVMVYPSLYEGFGIPVIEAMACGCPVVTSEISCLPYTASGAAVLVDPESPESIAFGIKRVIKNKDFYRTLGYKRIKNQASILKTCDLVRDIIY
jgi:glycosyltransferase involved in cell wall biosynthesis